MRLDVALLHGVHERDRPGVRDLLAAVEAARAYVAGLGGAARARHAPSPPPNSHRHRSDWFVPFIVPVATPAERLDDFHGRESGWCGEQVETCEALNLTFKVRAGGSTRVNSGFGVWGGKI